MKKKIIVEIIAGSLILLFTYTSVSKIIDHRTFQFQLGRAPYIGGLSGIMSFVLPVAELVIAVLLLFEKTRLAGLWASFIAMTLFTVYIALMLASGHRLPCTCGGVISSLSWFGHLLFNLVFTAIAFAGVMLYKKQGDGTASRSNRPLSKSPGYEMP
ncbi:hypothetical protein BDD43_4648 [Mucilaginibacter gracilis]|uniref:Methylamine utilisation protein MauE domain-containing protein n=1 Tax=Mucilaginibacter gracilis TaxID=423350 RepID=A0A495J6Q0_9SPHI|nr:MauE/DoxX family redox-associated membrane protein [Mucilaginibacter gracilis]RKR84413.1 hypothetical protein BDD43_4648 [Mucilaginibacter gracilis]